LRSPGGNAILDARVRKLSFTGSTEVGRLLLAQAAARVVKCSMELGGNAPFVVFADADLDAAIEGALIAKMRHNGEACTAANRFYVERAVAAEFTGRLSAAMAGLKIGNGLDPEVRVGALIDAATRAKVARLVEPRSPPACVQTGGRTVGPGFFFPPPCSTGRARLADSRRGDLWSVAPLVTFDDTGR
jgi:succinate-semialdehyde dehydrogenase/glutarate-semialdehyde dehydrogenase